MPYPGAAVERGASQFRQMSDGQDQGQAFELPRADRKERGADMPAGQSPEAGQDAFGVGRLQPLDKIAEHWRRGIADQPAEAPQIPIPAEDRIQQAVGIPGFGPGAIVGAVLDRSWNHPGPIRHDIGQMRIIGAVSKAGFESGCDVRGRQRGASGDPRQDGAPKIPPPEGGQAQGRKIGQSQDTDETGKFVPAFRQQRSGAMERRQFIKRGQYRNAFVWFQLPNQGVEHRP